MTTVVFLHGVGGGMPGWDTALREAVSAHAPTVAESLATVSINFDDLIGRRGPIRLVPAAHLHVPIVSDKDRYLDRVRYLLRQQRLRTVTWNSPDRVRDPRFRTPVFLPGELIVRWPMWDMRQAGHYRHDDVLRAEVLDRISDALNEIEGEIVVLAHSLGSVIALDALHVRDIRVKLLVSFGSPLGARHFWGEHWEDQGTFPYDRVGGWLNVINVKDVVSWKRGVSQRFPQAVDAYVSAGVRFAGPDNFHDASTYVRTDPVVRTLVDTCG
jgi:pimeloyl-ACP methyl ester carboxylesterase